jgi:signal transduction histidine kinase
MPLGIFLFIHILGPAPIQTHVMGSLPVVFFGFVGFLFGKIRELSLQIKAELQQRIEMEQHTDKLHKQLLYTEKMQAIGELSGGIAHDFNNLIGAILGYAQLTLASETNSLHTRENIGQIVKVCNRASETVNSILSFCKSDDSKKLPLPINTLVIESLNLIKPLFPASLIMQSDISQQLSVVKTHASHIHKILINLCANASHAMNGCGTLTVSLHEKTVATEIAGEFFTIIPRAYAVLSVSDTGCGIPDSVRKNIFDPFFTTKPPDKGTGLGLSVVYGIVMDLSGAIVLNSKESCGTTFEIFLPIWAKN